MVLKFTVKNVYRFRIGVIASLAMDIRKTAVSLACLCLSPVAVQATDYDYKKILAEVSVNSGASDTDKRLWLSYLDKAAGVPAEVTRRMFKDAADEFRVPQALLEAIGYLENNWIQIGPSIDKGWGIMHLVDNDYSHTLIEAARLLGLDPQVLKDDPGQNIRGAAALLASYAGTAGAPAGTSDTTKQPLLENVVRTVQEIFPAASQDAVPDAARTPDPADVPGAIPGTALEDWFAAASKFSGLRTRELRDQQARNYFAVIDKGVVEKNVLNQIVRIEPIRVDPGRIRSAAAGDSPPRSPDYPEALSDISLSNFTWGRKGQKIDTFVQHWMGVGTYAGAISWFHNPNANASAHFCIRNSDGEVTQVIRVDNTAWHSGCPTCPWTNNARSIGVEHEVTVTHPEWWNSEPMLNASAGLTRFFCDKYRIPLKHPSGLGVTGGIIGHNQVPGCTEDSGCHTDCPGPLPWDTLMQKITGIREDPALRIPERLPEVSSLAAGAPQGQAVNGNDRSN